jgi:hypothetical protein
MNHLDVPGVLLLHHHELVARASTVMEHVEAFRRYSQFAVWNVNTALGFPQGLRGCRFHTIVLHYSLFGMVPYQLDERFLDYLDRSETSYKIAFFQDEHHYCRQRFGFLDRHNVDCVYTLIEPEYFQQVYQQHTRVPKLIYTIPGYVSDDLVALGRRFTKPDGDRRIDIGYRGRKLSPYMGQGSQEKYDIAVRFHRHAERSGLKLDIESDESRRIYGDQWYQFLANCRAVLGVEAGVSIFDVDDIVRTEYERVMAEYPDASFEELSGDLLHQWEGNIPYRTISPRHFEAAAFRTCQILFEGAYSGIMQPMEHYIPLKKDFSNVEDVLTMFRDGALRRELTENAYRDLIASGNYKYRRFVEGFDRDLQQQGLQPKIAPDTIAAVDRLLRRDSLPRQLRALLRATLYYPFPGRRIVQPKIKQVLIRYEGIKAGRLHKPTS